MAMCMWSSFTANPFFSADSTTYILDLKTERPLYASTRVGQTLTQSLEQAHVLAGLAAQSAGWPMTGTLKGNIHLTMPRERSNAGPATVTRVRLYIPDLVAPPMWQSSMPTSMPRWTSWALLDMWSS